jgi:tetratricopeptide (TPR) repeat protein
MTWLRCKSDSWLREPGVAIVESEAGKARDQVVARWRAARRAAGDRTWSVPCRPGEGGPWAGVSHLFSDVADELRPQAPDLLQRHARELGLVVPALRADLRFPESLTEEAGEGESFRQFAVDRAYRCLHGLIDLLAEWHLVTSPGSVSIACESFDRANKLVQRFFLELARRRGTMLGLRLLLVVGPGAGEQTAAELDRSVLNAKVRLELPRAGDDAARPEAMTDLAYSLESALSDDPAMRDAQLPPLIDAWKRSTAPRRALRWEVMAMVRCNLMGLFEASLPYAADLEGGLEWLYEEDRTRYFEAVGALFDCYIALARGESALPLLERALIRADDDTRVVRYCYLLAMLHTRHLHPADLQRAESYLQRAARVLEDGMVPECDRHFLAAFTMNGLALVRLRQRRMTDALELCQRGIDRLDAHFGPRDHRLLRSILLFNIAQIYARTGAHGAALDYYDQALVLDPNYSEYYSDRGSVYLKMGRFQRAEQDYRRALELTPPSAEISTNLGQCYRAMGRIDDALAAYSRALDLNPGLALALAGRGEAYSESGQMASALADYERALSADAHQPDVLASRAIIHYQAGRPIEALADLNAAVSLAPDLAELYQNRAVALCDIDRISDAARDLRTYLQLRPHAEDRHEVERTLQELEAAGQTAVPS